MASNQQAPLPFVRILGVDLGFASIGTAIIQVYRSPEPIVIEDAEFFSTAPSTAKLKIRVVDYALLRLEEIGGFFEMRMMSPHLMAIACEAPSYNQKASTQSKLGLAYVYGVLREGARREGLPLLQATPQEIKKHLLGSGAKSSKEDVQRRVQSLFPASQSIWPGAKGKSVHCIDAAAAAIVCASSREVQLAVNARGTLP